MTEDRGQRSEGRGQMKGSRFQVSGVRRQRGMKWEVGMRNSEKKKLGIGKKWEMGMGK